MTALATTSSTPLATPAAAPAAIAARGLRKVIDERPILHDLALDIPRGAFVALLGANGAGKSTLLKLLATLTTPTAGELTLLGLPVKSNAAKVRGRIGLIGHQSMLYHDLSARENLVFFGKLYGIKNPAARADHLLDSLGLLHRANDPVKAFSRGMTQRVAIARALVHDPELVLADEPFAGLDAPSAAVLESVLAQLHRAGKTIVLANHDIAQSLRLSRHAVVLRRGRKVIDAPSDSLSAPDVLAHMTAAQQEGRP